MLEELKKEANKTVTLNGAVTFKSTGTHCLDLFSSIGAMRLVDKSKIFSSFLLAYTEDPDLATKILFFARDIREGLGEREIFRTIIKGLTFHHPETVRKNLQNIPEFGRFDDLLCLMDTPCEEDTLTLLKTKFDEDMQKLRTDGNVSLLGKWLPSINTSNKEARAKGRKIAKFFGLTLKDYRLALVALRKQIKIVENYMRERDYSFNYSNVPSKAMSKYRNAFLLNDKERFQAFLESVERGEVKINTSTLLPCDLVHKVVDNHPLTEGEKKTLNVLWKKLPSIDDDSNTLAVIDTSASMTWSLNSTKPIDVAISLGLFFAEHNKGKFANHYIEFSESPCLVEIKGKDFVSKVEYICSKCVCENTNIEAVFDLVLNTAIKNKMKQKKLPKRLIFISDMQFDSCTNDASLTNFENAKQNFENAGYKLPEIVFWNVNSITSQQPVTQNEQGVVLVSGYTPKLFEMVSQNIINPTVFMLDVLSSERYKTIVA